MRSTILLPRRVVPQPRPHLHPGGDCGACVLGGLVGLQVPEVYGRISGGHSTALDWWTMRSALSELEAGGLCDRIVTDPPSWSVSEPLRCFGAPGHQQSLAWWTYLRMALDGGYYGIALVDHGKRGPLGPGPDHWVLLAGVRERLRPFSTGGGGSYAHEILVSNSSAAAQAEEWVEASGFLRDSGGFNVHLARPAAR